MIYACPPWHLAPMQPAERTPVRARLANFDGYAAADAPFAAAISAPREHSTPYHLAHRVLDRAGNLTRLGDTGAAETAISQARDIAECLRCQHCRTGQPPDAAHRTSDRARMLTAPGPEESATARDG